jgi:hypothetical protein
VKGLQSIEKDRIQAHIDTFLNKRIYIHLETSTGSYVGVGHPETLPACAYIRNGVITCTEGKIVKNEAWYSVGLKIDNGWVYVEGLTDWELLDDGKLLLGGHDQKGNLKIGLELSHEPFDCGK